MIGPYVSVGDGVQITKCIIKNNGCEITTFFPWEKTRSLDRTYEIAKGVREPINSLKKT